MITRDEILLAETVKAISPEQAKIMLELRAEVDHMNNVNNKRITEYQALEKENARLRAALENIEKHSHNHLGLLKITGLAQNALKGGPQ